MGSRALVLSASLGLAFLALSAAGELRTIVLRTVDDTDTISFDSSKISEAQLRELILLSPFVVEYVNDVPGKDLFAAGSIQGSTPDKQFGYFDSTVNGGWSVPNEPYMVRRSDQPGWHEATDINHHGTKQNFMWWRPRMLGGRTNHWGRIALRMGPYDFKPKARDGLGLDWPINYEDLAPWYDKTEALIGVFGSNEGLENTPDSSPGVLQPPPRPRGYELLIKRGAGKLGIPVVPSHQAILSCCGLARVSSRMSSSSPSVSSHRCGPPSCLARSKSEAA